MHPAPTQVYPSNRTETPPQQTLPRLRDLASREPLAVYEGPERLAEMLGAPAWCVELALDALALDEGIAA